MDESSKIIIYTDGASRGNPGESAAGVMMWDANGDPIGRLSLYLGHLTNNQAEYKAVLAALLAAYVQGHQHVEFRLDSELVVRQLSGQYKIKDAKLKALATQVQNAAARLESVTFNHIKRTGNDQADSLANEILDQRADDDLPI